MQIKWPDHFPETSEAYSPQRLAAMGPKRYAAAIAHIKKMCDLREEFRRKMQRINAKAAAGACYCDDEYRCATHAAEQWAEQQRLAASAPTG